MKRYSLHGAVPTGNDFGNWTTATKAGVKFNDLDADGAAREAGEPGLPGWTIYVDYDNDGVKDANEPSAVTARPARTRSAGSIRVLGGSRKLRRPVGPTRSRARLP